MLNGSDADLCCCVALPKLNDCKFFCSAILATVGGNSFLADRGAKLLMSVSFGPLGHLNFGVFELKQILIHPHLGAPSSVTFRLALRDEVCWFESTLDDVG